MKILLTGSNGQLGSCFQDRVPSHWDILPTDSDTLDITNKDAVISIVDKFKPDVIVNAAAYTAVDKAEQDYELARLVNEVGPQNLAYAARLNGIRLVHVSTDYVFDGTSNEPYVESDPTNPLGVYGTTKLAGEKCVLETLEDSIILRTAWVFSEYGNNFVKTMLRIAKDNSTIKVVNDQIGCPTYAGDIALAIIELINFNSVGGIYHYCGGKNISWCGFASKIFEYAQKSGVLINVPIVIGISTSEYPTPVKRPSYSVLNTSKIEKIGVLPSDWESALETIMVKLK
ncbi:MULTISPECIES: dTDP-4-dehydrorhamnose reductase [Klebsiella pneumoniae complex]|uniref:dTDP-4-dehydrorhamnose reductase n=1 Tax=Klebsiella sp. 7522 TaxID=1497811 RepID=A0A0P0YR36_9ENTR|nr:dTDP-4-dehydrorhamnose reductase [Klebsiella pneumoniae]BAT23638.1 dTDP-6-deoxy-L-mannose dehydrogenase/ dTDP-4-dehydrorhamnose reductase [Klebsiella sp. 7522]EKW2889504.1 dTDP-4-dehydrorhamnose reductase [Klebsiella pneumoniae]ELA0628204.1 dTDP-4-dehydrorhamnose reductase [Klebsiella pneumoniae]MBC4126026.1 dTDP-4-dehydrorhamnose reductase [Klebsiella pneumoniae]MBC4908704.1 dTDP-4-dehydrorhamnose reductase [Klebsiella pneumoniae]